MKKIEVKIRRETEDKDIPLPVYMTAHAAGMDIHAAINADVVLAPGERYAVPAGFSIALPEGFEAQIRPRSGLALKHGITLLNSPGTIDSDYRGEIKIILINHSDSPYTVKRGDRIAQMIIGSVVRAEFICVDELEETERNKGGFGHTG